MPGVRGRRAEAVPQIVDANGLQLGVGAYRLRQTPRDPNRTIRLDSRVRFAPNPRRDEGRTNGEPSTRGSSSRSKSAAAPIGRPTRPVFVFPSVATAFTLSMASHRRAHTSPIRHPESSAKRSAPTANGSAFTG